MKISNSPYFTILLLGLLFGCEQNKCLDPTPIPQNPTDTQYVDRYVYVFSLKSGPGNDVDALLVYNNATLGNVGNPGHPTIYAEAWTNGGFPQLCRSLIDFPLNSIPSGATITKATLTLFADTTTPVPPKFGHYNDNGPNDWVIKKVITSWDKNFVTWNTQPLTNNVDTLLMPSSTFDDQRYDVDITTFIQERYANPTSHYGYLIKLNNESIYRSIAFCSSNHSYSQLTPELKIEYTK